MTLEVKTSETIDADAWDSYVHAHPSATLYHLSAWKNVIEKTYGHKTYYLMATKNTQYPVSSAQQWQSKIQNVVGVLPLVHLKHFLFGNSLISIPFFDLGGILADDNETEKALLSEAIKLGQELKAKTIELRHTQPLSCLNEVNPTNLHTVKCGSYLTGAINPCSPLTYATKSHKVRMLLDLPPSSEILMKSFKSKLRNKIRKPMKEGLTSKVGGVELLDDFYEVFSINMRDLGSPVHSKKLMRNVLEEFAEKTKIVMVYKNGQPLACSMIVGFKDTLENPWASALREYSRLSPNMLLYWTMLEYACDNGYAYFDFGRCSPDEGTYKFKEQWGAKPEPLYWHYVSFDVQTIDTETSEKSKFDRAIQCWQKLPVSFTKMIGPMIRKHIGL